jgi:hypothetical protein
MAKKAVARFASLSIERDQLGLFVS